MSKIFVFKKKWLQLSIRHQLRIVLIGFAAVLLITIFTSVYFTARQILLSRGFQLLELSQKSAIGSFNKYLNENPNLNKWGSLSNHLTDRTGLGASGETYLMDDNGTLLTESRFTNNPPPAPIPEFTSSRWQGLKPDYRDISVLAIWNQLKISNQTLYLASEIDLEEVLLPLERLTYWMGGLLVILSLLILALSPWLSKFFLHNIEKQQELLATRQRSLIEGQELERQKISMDLHDDLGPRLAALAWQIESFVESVDKKNILQKGLSEISIQTRNLSGQLSLNILHHHGFKALCKSFFENVLERAIESGVEFEWEYADAKNNLEKLSTGQAIALYRVMQESIENTFKHSKATQVQCQIIANTDGGVNLLVSDNGQGFDSNFIDTKIFSGMGLRNMQTRIESIGGKISIHSRPNKGTLIQVAVSTSKEGSYENLHH
ncbi:MAG: sensor histidine kinase [Pseudobdellovibrionaceae bacterium]